MPFWPDLDFVTPQTHTVSLYDSKLSESDTSDQMGHTEMCKVLFHYNTGSISCEIQLVDKPWQNNRVCLYLYDIDVVCFQ